MLETQDSVKTKVFGIPINVTGINAIVVMILAMALGFAGYLLMYVAQKNEEHLENLAAQHADAMERQAHQGGKEHEMLLNGLKSIAAVNEKIGELIEEQNYIVLSDDKDRKDMKQRLRRPPSLTKKLEH